MEWTEESILQLVQAQRSFFKSGTTLDVKWRLQQLRKLKKAVKRYENRLLKALKDDLGRDKIEAYFCDIGTTYREINDGLKHLRRWARPEKRFSGLVCYPALRTVVHKMPYGVCLIISPFNFPILLTLGVLVAAIEGGNTAILKTSSKSPNCTAVLKELIAETFPPEYITVVDGGHEVADLCLAQRMDKIFYTGSPRVAVHVLEAAAKNLTPVGLELGGETGNWCVIRKDADLKDAAEKIAFFKLCNSGQICININQIAVAQEVAEEFLEELKAAYQKQIGENALENPEYPCMITDAAYRKCADEAELYRERIVFGGTGDPETRKYAPTIIYPVQNGEPIVMHELFSPLLPVVPYPDAAIGEQMEQIARGEHGLALYLFTKDMKWAKQTMASQQYGGGCINEVCLQLMTSGAPFNGVGHSGMGSYHGEWGFREFTHPSTVLMGKTKGNLPLREHPYRGAGRGLKLLLIRMMER